MFRATKNIAFVLLGFFLTTVAGATSISTPPPLKERPAKSELSTNFGASNEATKQTYTQGHQILPAKQFSPTTVIAFRVQYTHSTIEYYFLFNSQPTFFHPALYYSSRCNKAPPAI